MVACFDDKGNIVQQLKFPTSPDYEQFLKDLKTNVANLKNSSFSIASFGLPGSLNRQDGILISAGNLSWKNRSVKKDFTEVLDCPVLIENEANMAGFSDAKLVADSYKKVLYITIGTGIGIAIIENGIIDITKGDSGGKHITLNHNGKQEEWEDFASGRAIVKQYGKKARDITDAKIWQEIVNNLALGIKELLAEIEPDAVIIGGGVGANFDKFGKLLGSKFDVPILKAQHPEEAVLYGCYELARQRHENVN